MLAKGGNMEINLEEILVNNPHINRDALLEGIKLTEELRKAGGFNAPQTYEPYTRRTVRVLGTPSERYGARVSVSR